METQERIVAEIESSEAEIARLRERLDTLITEKANILQKHL